ncbi:unnamed protein product, partial [Pleuronectes platessa]
MSAWCRARCGVVVGSRGGGLGDWTSTDWLGLREDDIIRRGRNLWGGQKDEEFSDNSLFTLKSGQKPARLLIQVLIAVRQAGTGTGPNWARRHYSSVVHFSPCLWSVSSCCLLLAACSRCMAAYSSATHTCAISAC